MSSRISFQVLVLVLVLGTQFLVLVPQVLVLEPKVLDNNTACLRSVNAPVSLQLCSRNFMTVIAEIKCILFDSAYFTVAELNFTVGRVDQHVNGRWPGVMVPLPPEFGNDSNKK